ncbi:hypothetical protein ACFE04_017589 [Oxalis oulophora]
MKLHPLSSSSTPNINILRKARLSPAYFFTLLAFIVFVSIIYGEDLICIFGQLEPYTNTTDHDDQPLSSPELKKLDHQKKLPFAIENTNEECDVFSGRWVWDDSSRPLYEENECPYIQPQLTCQEHGRPDRDYQYWRWQPNACDLPR